MYSILLIIVNLIIIFALIRLIVNKMHTFAATNAIIKRENLNKLQKMQFSVNNILIF